jgi:hypothetical protein
MKGGKEKEGENGGKKKTVAEGEGSGTDKFVLPSNTVHKGKNTSNGSKTCKKNRS